ncbi:6-carboxytetrahydropterin synthase QueD [Hippea maritima]|uniref:6-carboxy-5,6,7,8-tetrahydropterin synthase n=1 Tax=Hippea maritima (strain ATCC 700847 / DSM 10411 / MH2) TaxID=760142 RepID=F2LW99_HIPMA|nr:6-carboxytetrahydropterin synthase QueD [Hippea maritima]AEA34033.1 queuosine biosynthesis protein QueD [Hippea maritima DSM 10411]
MFEITITDDFAAAHRLNNYNGACENLHGHNFIVEVSVLCDKLDKAYIAIDFKELKSLTKEIVSKLDHRYLNELEPFKSTNPTSEMIAKYIFEELKKALKDRSCKPSKVSVFESLKAKATYFETQ